MSQAENEEILICSYCGRNEKECEEQTEEEQNPITDWCGWGLSCDDCYYKNHPEEDQDDFTNRICENCSKEFDLSDPHYYDEEQGVCYCSEKCYKIDTAEDDDDCRE